MYNSSGKKSWIRHARKLIKYPEYRLKHEKLVIHGSKIIREYIESSNNKILTLAHYDKNDHNGYNDNDKKNHSDNDRKNHSDNDRKNHSDNDKNDYNSSILSANHFSLLPFAPSFPVCNKMKISQNEMKFITGEARPEGPIAEISWPDNCYYSLDSLFNHYEKSISNFNIKFEKKRKGNMETKNRNENEIEAGNENENENENIDKSNVNDIRMDKRDKNGKGNNNDNDGLTIVLYGLSDPTNVGSIFRSALALNWNRIILSESSSHPFGPESIRSSMGSVLMMPFAIIPKNILDKWLFDNCKNVMIGDCNDTINEMKEECKEGNNDKSNNENEIDPLIFKWNVKKNNYNNGKIILVMGSESHGTRDIPKEFRNQYDSDVTVWSPQGRLFQVEYAMEAVKQGSCSVGLCSRTHVVLVALKRSPADLASHQRKIIRIDDHFGIALSGLTSDARVLTKIMHREALKLRMEQSRLIPVARLVENIAHLAQVNTQEYGGRPFGVGLLIASANSSPSPSLSLSPHFINDNDEGENQVHLWEFSPNGMAIEYRATAIGARSQSARTWLENHVDEFEELDLENLIMMGLKALRETIPQADTLLSFGPTGNQSDRQQSNLPSLSSSSQNQQLQLTKQNCSIAYVSLVDNFTILNEDEVEKFVQRLPPIVPRGSSNLGNSDTGNDNDDGSAAIAIPPTTTNIIANQSDNNDNNGNNSNLPLQGSGEGNGQSSPSQDVLMQ